ncbi:predicted protein [Nematostella vectensis]|uniref:Uncharacterized protein n=1 Tax=Nematostella vectensis TaxID=45351 RepID=A7RKW7_NEMVE|nr:predicted protein [Nematostella vectensis]|eukprot:XP_001639818.1 predicted protein [Nematostella vectensis]
MAPRLGITLLIALFNLIPSIASVQRCMTFDEPKNGYVVCDSLFRLFCSPVCHPGYRFVTKPAVVYMCGPVTGEWFTYPVGSGVPWPDCIPDDGFHHLYEYIEKAQKAFEYKENIEKEAEALRKQQLENRHSLISSNAQYHPQGLETYPSINEYKKNSRMVFKALLSKASKDLDNYIQGKTKTIHNLPQSTKELFKSKGQTQSSKRQDLNSNAEPVIIEFPSEPQLEELQKQLQQEGNGAQSISNLVQKQQLKYMRMQNPNIQNRPMTTLPGKGQPGGAVPGRLAAQMQNMPHALGNRLMQGARVMPGQVQTKPSAMVMSPLYNVGNVQGLPAKQLALALANHYRQNSFFQNGRLLPLMFQQKLDAIRLAKRPIKGRPLGAGVTYPLQRVPVQIKGPSYQNSAVKEKEVNGFIVKELARDKAFMKQLQLWNNTENQKEKAEQQKEQQHTIQPPTPQMQEQSEVNQNILPQKPQHSPTQQQQQEQQQQIMQKQQKQGKLQEQLGQHLTQGPLQQQQQQLPRQQKQQQPLQQQQSAPETRPPQQPQQQREHYLQNQSLNVTNTQMPVQQGSSENTQVSQTGDFQAQIETVEPIRNNTQNNSEQAENNNNKQPQSNVQTNVDASLGLQVQQVVVPLSSLVNTGSQMMNNQTSSEQVNSQVNPQAAGDTKQPQENTRGNSNTQINSPYPSVNMTTEGSQYAPGQSNSTYLTESAGNTTSYSNGYQSSAYPLINQTDNMNNTEMNKMINPDNSSSWNSSIDGSSQQKMNARELYMAWLKKEHENGDKPMSAEESYKQQYLQWLARQEEVKEAYRKWLDDFMKSAREKEIAENSRYASTQAATSAPYASPPPSPYQQITSPQVMQSTLSPPDSQYNQPSVSTQGSLDNQPRAQGSLDNQPNAQRQDNQPNAQGSQDDTQSSGSQDSTARDLYIAWLAKHKMPIPDYALEPDNTEQNTALNRPSRDSQSHVKNSTKSSASSQYPETISQAIGLKNNESIKQANNIKNVLTKEDFLVNETSAVLSENFPGSESNKSIGNAFTKKGSTRDIPKTFSLNIPKNDGIASNAIQKEKLFYFPIKNKETFISYLLTKHTNDKSKY